MTFEEWHKLGFELGFCGPAVCIIHDGLPTTTDEDTELEEHDPCVHVLRLYETVETKTAVEENHPPSVWRASNAGLI